MSKLDMYPYLPDKPLADGDSLYKVKKVSNNYRTVIHWLLDNAIDHKLSIIDSDTDWNDIDNFSVYRFTSVQGPHAPEETQIGGREGIVIETSAGTGEHYQMAFTKNGAAFRTLHSEWFYIGHGIPADVDVSKLVDQEHLGKVLENYYTKPEVDQITNNIYDYVEGNYYTKPEIDNFRQSQAATDSLQNHQGRENRAYTTIVSSNAARGFEINSAGILKNSNSINTLSSEANKQSLSIDANTASINEVSNSVNAPISSNAKSIQDNTASIKSLSESTNSNTIANFNKNSLLSNSTGYQISLTNSNVVSLSTSTNTQISSNSTDISSLSSFDSSAINSNTDDLTKLSESTSSGMTSNSSRVDSLSSSANSSTNALSLSTSSDASVSGADGNNQSYTSLIVTSSQYSANGSFASNSVYNYEIIGSSSNGINPNSYINKANSLAQLNYNNTMNLNEYTYNATHFDNKDLGPTVNSYEDNGSTVALKGRTAVPLKEVVRSNYVSMASEIASMTNNDGFFSQATYPLYNMYVHHKTNQYNCDRIAIESIQSNQQSNQADALGSIYANTSNIAFLTSQANYVASSMSSSASSSTSALSLSASSSISSVNSYNSSLNQSLSVSASNSVTALSVSASQSVSALSSSASVSIINVQTSLNSGLSINPNGGGTPTTGINVTVICVMDNHTDSKAYATVDFPKGGSQQLTLDVLWSTAGDIVNYKYIPHVPIGSTIDLVQAMGGQNFTGFNGLDYVMTDSSRKVTVYGYYAYKLFCHRGTGGPYAS